jgi:hypothetical protein
VDVELLTIQVRLVITSVDKARELGMDWWLRDVNRPLNDRRDPSTELAQLEHRVSQLERAEAEGSGAVTAEATLVPGPKEPAR